MRIQRGAESRAGELPGSMTLGRAGDDARALAVSGKHNEGDRESVARLEGDTVGRKAAE